MDRNDCQDQQGVEEVLERLGRLSQEAEEGENARRRQKDRGADDEALLESVQQGSLICGATGLATAQAAGGEALFLEKSDRGHG